MTKTYRIKVWRADHKPQIVRTWAQLIRMIAAHDATGGIVTISKGDYALVAHVFFV